LACIEAFGLLGLPWLASPIDRKDNFREEIGGWEAASGCSKSPVLATVGWELWLFHSRDGWDIPARCTSSKSRVRWEVAI
jgi:hypothetical protein